MRRKQEGIVYHDFGASFDTLSHKILIDKIMKYGLDEQRGGVKSV